MSTRTYGSKAADEAGERLNQLCAQHSTTVKAFNGHTRFGVSTDDHRVLLEVEDQGEQVFVHWLHDEEAREIAGALNRAVSWLNEEEVASAEFTLALDAADTNTKEDA